MLCEAVAEHLCEHGLVMPSVYLRRGDRLRCYAARGYQQVYDGMPPSAGVIGRTYRTGVVTHVRSVPSQSDYLAAVPGVVEELCVPIRMSGEVVGALNLEGVHELPPNALELLTTAADMLAGRLVVLGGPPQESGAQRLARHAEALAGATTEAAVAECVSAAARELAQMSSAMVALGHGVPLRAAAVAGPLGARLAEIDETGLALLASWVESGTSCYSRGDGQGAGFIGHEVLSRTGTAAFVALPLVAGSERLGLLLVADADRQRFDTGTVELLELLSAITATCLRTAEAMEELRRRASSDPLTGLGHHASFQGALSAALGRLAAGAGREVAVIMIDLDGFKTVNDTRGHPAGDHLLRIMSTRLAGALRGSDQLYRIGGDEFATVVEVGEHSEAVAVAERLHRAARDGEDGTTVSIGVALAMTGEDDASLVARADAALYQVKRRGRDGILVAPLPDAAA